MEAGGKLEESIKWDLVGTWGGIGPVRRQSVRVRKSFN